MGNRKGVANVSPIWV